MGHNLCKRLVAEGHQVRGTTHLRDGPKVEGVEYIHADLTKLDHARWALEGGVDHAFQCAACVIGAGGMLVDPLGYAHTNSLIYLNTIHAAHEMKVRKFYSLGSTTSYPVSDYPMTEDRIFEGQLFPYYFTVGTVKRFAESLAVIHGETLKTMEAVISIRPSNVYGPYDNFNFKTSHVLGALIHKVVKRQNPIEVWGDGSDLRDLIYIDDMIELMVRCMKLEGYHAINAGTGVVNSINQMLGMAMAAAEYEAPVTYIKDKPRMIPVRRVSILKAKELLGFEAKVELRDGIQKTVDWLHQNMSIARL